MSDNISIVNAHTGAAIPVNRHYFLTLEELRRFCSTQLNIPRGELFLLTSDGHRLKASSIEHAEEIYVFDKNLFTTDSTEGGIQRYVARMYADELDTLIPPIHSPLEDVDLERLSRTKDSRRLVGLLTTNLGWIAAIGSDSALYLKRAHELKAKCSALFKSIRVANLYIQTYHTEVQKSYDSTMDFLSHLQQQSLSVKWIGHYTALESINTLDGIALCTLLDKSQLSRDADESVILNQELSRTLAEQSTRLATCRQLHSEVDSRIDTIESGIEAVFAVSDGQQWLDELKNLCEKTQGETRRLLEHTKDSMDNLSVDLILETFQQHRKEYVQKIYMHSSSLYKLLTSYKERYTRLQVSLSTCLVTISAAQSEMVILKESLRSMSPRVERVQDLESSLAHTIDLPLLYGLYVIEGFRRLEWLKAAKLEASRSNEDFATLREREIKLRSSWVQRYGDILKLLNKNISSFSNDGITSFEITINTDDSQDAESELTFDDAKGYVEQLETAGVSGEVVRALFKSLEDIPSKLLKRAPSEQNPSRDSVIQGYKTRIRKLESLLHQAQFKSFQQWPSSDRMSTMSRLSLNGKLDFSSLKESTLKDSSVSQFSSSPDMAKLIEENRTLSNNIKRHSNTIEMLNEELKGLKHQVSSADFENSALKRDMERVNDDHSSKLSQFQLRLTGEEAKNAKIVGELSELQKALQEHEKKSDRHGLEIVDLKAHFETKISRLESQIKSKDAQIATLKDEAISPAHVDHLNTEVEDLKRQLQLKDSQLAVADEELQKKVKVLTIKDELLAEKDVIIKKMDESSSDKLKTWTTRTEGLIKENDILSNRLDTSKDDYERLKSMKNDLLENMSNRENEFSSEKSVHQQEIEQLKSKLEELEFTCVSHNTDIGQLTEQVSNHSHTIFQLVVIINSLIIKSRDLSDILVTFYGLFCATLKSMGLLAVRSEVNGAIAIMRVKGLRKGNLTDLSNTVDLAAGLTSDLELAVQSSSVWTELPERQLMDLSLPESERGSESITSLVDTLIETYNLTTFEEKYLRFVDLVTNLNALYLSSISKRFKEVEHLAKKELKDNKRLRESDGKKISIRDFNKNDLVLFLPTRSNDSTGTSHAWAVFNDVGDVKFLMKNELKLSPQKQWFIGKILEMEEVNSKEFLITAEEVVFS